MKGAISIGSHYAEEFEGWISLGCQNFIFFEPIVANYNRMVKILPKSPAIKTFRIALGNMTGKAVMNVEKVHQGKSCSVLTPTNHLKQYPDIIFDSVEYVKIDKLDNIEYDRNLYDHIHIDTQGYELEVLKGGVNSLVNIQTAQIEVYRDELYEGCAMFKEVVDFMFDHGFSIESVYWRGNTWGDANFRRLPIV